MQNKYNVIITDTAREDLWSIHLFIARDSVYYADIVTSFLIKWSRDILSIAPYIGHFIDEPAWIREVVDPDYWYTIRFLIKNEQVFVLMYYKWQLRGK